MAEAVQLQRHLQCPNAWSWHRRHDDRCCPRPLDRGPSQVVQDVRVAKCPESLCTGELMNRLLLLLHLAVLAITACAPEPCQNSDYRVLAKIRGGGSGTKFIVSGQSSEEKLIALASSACGSRWCKLLIWDSPSAAARSFPLTDRQAADQVAAYTHNPNNGFEELVVRGKLIPMGSCSNR